MSNTDNIRIMNINKITNIRGNSATTISDEATYRFFKNDGKTFGLYYMNSEEFTKPFGMISSVYTLEDFGLNEEEIQAIRDARIHDFEFLQQIWANAFCYDMYGKLEYPEIKMCKEIDLWHLWHLNRLGELKQYLPFYRNDQNKLCYNGSNIIFNDVLRFSPYEKVVINDGEFVGFAYYREFLLWLLYLSRNSNLEFSLKYEHPYEDFWQTQLKYKPYTSISHEEYVIENILRKLRHKANKELNKHICVNDEN